MTNLDQRGWGVPSASCCRTNCAQLPIDRCLTVSLRTVHHGPSRAVAELTKLAELLDGVGEGGRLVLIAGEAGAGKSALVEAFIAEHGDCRVLVGAVRRSVRAASARAARRHGSRRNGPLGRALDAGDQTAALDAFLVELIEPPHPVVVVLEDLQWADEATLDLVSFVARRLDSLPCLILATHRVELAPDHPLRRTIGSLVGPSVTRLSVPALSVEAVAHARGGIGHRPGRAPCANRRQPVLRGRAAGR